MSTSSLLRAAVAAAALCSGSPALADCPGCTPDNLPPSISLTSPAMGATAVAPGAFTLSATATDDGYIDAVEFFVNNVSVGVDSTAPYSLQVTGLAVGNYSIQAKATDDAGQSTLSSQRSVTVNPPPNLPPTVSLTSPGNNASGTSPATFVLTASASDQDGLIASVQFKQGSTVLATDSSYPYSFSWPVSASGTYTLTAVATDNGGLTATSGSVSVTVTPAGNIAPSVSLTSPGSGSVVGSGYAFNMTAAASDSDGSVASVKFLSNGAVVATDTTAPYSFSYAPPGSGNYSLQAIATDNVGSSTSTSAVSVSVNPVAVVSETRSYVYDSHHRLCKTINPESGATVVEYDIAGNVLWTADGLNLPSTTSCDRNLVATAQQSSRTYDAMNRVTQVSTPGGTANVTTTYFADGEIRTLTAANPGGNNVVTTYAYNKRRLLTSEVQTNGTTTYTVTYGYDANAHLKSIGYPDLEVVDYAPDALGRPTAVVGTSATYASGVSYFPNGAMSGFKYGPASGPGPSHVMTQNVRQLPSRSQDLKTGTGAITILDDSYSYDANGNVTDIVDAVQTGAASQTRGMAYDGLDRLTAAVGPWGNATYAYDALDNLVRADQGTRKFRYAYASNWRLASIKDPAGTTLYSFGYDPQGNVTAKNSQTFTFDTANRMNSAATISGVAGNQLYRYDGMGRRVQTTDPDGKPSFYLYTQAAQVIYASEARNSYNRSYIYLNGSQIAQRTKSWSSGAVSVRYQMTDALSSPVASSNTNADPISIQRTSYTPWGEASPALDGSGYTGHVMDATTGLTYMQQRFYDPTVGRFWSVDPAPVAQDRFNRFDYASDNPYRNTDPDGRSPIEAVFLAADVAELGVAIASGEGVGVAVLMTVVDIAGTASPIPGISEVAHGIRGATKAVEVARAARGGAAMVEKGKEGVRLSREAREAIGHQHVADEVTVVTEHGRTRVDQVFKDSEGRTYGLESKNGPHAKVNPNQEGRFGEINSGGEHTMVGGNASRAGLEGQSLDRVEVEYW